MLNSVKPWFPGGNQAVFGLTRVEKIHHQGSRLQICPIWKLWWEWASWNLNQIPMAFFQTSVPPKKGYRSQLPGGVWNNFSETLTFTPPKGGKNNNKKRQPFFDSNWVMIYFLKNPPHGWNIHVNFVVCMAKICQFLSFLSKQGKKNPPPILQLCFLVRLPGEALGAPLNVGQAAHVDQNNQQIRASVQAHMHLNRSWSSFSRPCHTLLAARALARRPDVFCQLHPMCKSALPFLRPHSSMDCHIPPSSKPLSRVFWHRSGRTRRGSPLAASGRLPTPHWPLACWPPAMAPEATRGVIETLQTAAPHASLLWNKWKLIKLMVAWHL